MKQNLAQALEWIDADEGPELNISSSEPGGSSKHGVSMTVLREWHAAHGLPAPTMNDMRAVDSKLAAEIYTARFADPIKFEALPAGVDYRLLDIAVNLGVTGAVMLLERVLGNPVQGKLDDDDLAEVASIDPTDLVKKLGAAWLDKKRAGGGWTKYGNGWTNRANRAEPRALSLIDAVPMSMTAKIGTMVTTVKADKATKEEPLYLSVKGKTSSWNGIIGVGLSVNDLRRYVAGLSFPSWRPSFMVLHNTGAPTLYTGASRWHSTTGDKRMVNLTDYYKNRQHWSGGPHAFVADDLIWPFTPFNSKGTHSPSWNGTALGIELVGDYNVETIKDGMGRAAYMNAVALFAILHEKLGLNPNTIKFHKEDSKTTHRDCPGKNIKKDQFVADVIEYMGHGGDIDHPTPIETTPLPAPKMLAEVNTDGLNVRQSSSASAKVLTSLKKGTKVAVDGSAMNGSTKWSHITVDGKGITGWVAARYLT